MEPINKIEGLDGLPSDIKDEIIKSQVVHKEGSVNITGDICKGVRKLCKDPSFIEHCSKAEGRTRKYINICREVLKTHRCIDAFIKYQPIREYYHGVYQLPPPRMINKLDSMSYYHSILDKRIHHSGGIYNIILGNIQDPYLDEEINIIKEKLNTLELTKDKIYEYNKELKALEEEKDGLKLDGAAELLPLSEEEKQFLTTCFNERNNDDEWVKYTIKHPIEFLFKSSDEILSNNLCYFFKDNDTIDQFGDPYFGPGQQQIQPPYGPPNGIMFLNDHWLMDIEESLDHFFNNIDNINTLLLHFEINKDVPREEQEKMKYKFLLMIAFLEDMYLLEKISVL